MSKPRQGFSVPLGVDVEQEEFHEAVRRGLQQDRFVVDGWNQDNVAASQTNVELSRAVGRWRVVRPGSVVGALVTSTEARTGGTLTVTVFKNTGLAGAAGASIGVTTVLNATNTSRKATLVPSATNRFLAGDELYLVVTTDASWTPITADIRCALEVEA